MTIEPVIKKAILVLCYFYCWVLAKILSLLPSLFFLSWFAEIERLESGPLLRRMEWAAKLVSFEIHVLHAFLQVSKPLGWHFQRLIWWYFHDMCLSSLRPSSILPTLLTLIISIFAFNSFLLFWTNVEFKRIFGNLLLDQKRIIVKSNRDKIVSDLLHVCD